MHISQSAKKINLEKKSFLHTTITEGRRPEMAVRAERFLSLKRLIIALLL